MIIHQKGLIFFHYFTCTPSRRQIITLHFSSKNIFSFLPCLKWNFHCMKSFARLQRSTSIRFMDQTNTEDQQSSIKKLWLRDQRRTNTQAQHKNGLGSTAAFVRKERQEIQLIIFIWYPLLKHTRLAQWGFAVWTKIPSYSNKKEADGMEAEKQNVCCAASSHEPIVRLLAFLLHTSHQHQCSSIFCFRLAMISITSGCMSNINTQWHCRSSDDDKWWLDIKWITALKGGKTEDV